MILVTGGTGLLGAHLLYKLAQDDVKIRAIYRKKDTLKRVLHVFSYFTSTPNLFFDKIEWQQADITDIPSLQNVFKNITQVYHCAALVSFLPKDYKRLRKVNIEGTANVVNLCLSHNIKKLCYVSSIAAIGKPTDETLLIKEDTPWNSEAENSVYAITKYGAEMEVWRGTQEGLDVVIVNPGIVLGAGFWKGKSSGNLFRQIYKGMSHYTNGIKGFVDVWDVVDAMYLLMQSSLKNESYILVSENISFKSFQYKVAEALHVKPPKKEAKPWLLAIAWRLDWLKSKLFRTRRRLLKVTVNSILNHSKFDNSKLKHALDFSFKPIDQSIKEVCDLFLKDIKTSKDR